jgi:hypothetical protein
VSPNGSAADITLRSRSGVIIIAGNVIAGSGADAPAAEFVAGRDVVGEQGQAGGSVNIESAEGVTITGTVRAGTGGRGASASAFGSGETLSAISGGGGSGGSVGIIGRLLALEGSIQSGDGGSGGPAAVDLSRGSAIGATMADALARSGGPGGRIDVAIRGKAGSVRLAGTLTAGRGGDTMDAECRGGVIPLEGPTTDRGLAVVEKGGDGGDIRIEAADSSQIVQAGGVQTAGIGGNAGKPGPGTRAIANTVARKEAEARAGGGGQPGRVFFASALKSQGDGGDSGDSTAQRRGLTQTSDRGSEHSGPTPGRGTRAISQ